MSDLRIAAQQALEAMEREIDTRRCKVSTLRAMNGLRAALAEPLTDEQISDLWHQSGEQPFKFARMLLK